MRTVKTPTLTPTAPTTAAAEAAQIVLGLVERVAPTADRPGFRADLHAAAQALQRAFGAGASMDAVLAHLIMATAPPVEAPPVEPWKLVLGLSFDEFSRAGVGLHVRLPARGGAQVRRAHRGVRGRRVPGEGPRSAGRAGAVRLR
jgi:hypothetical protein